MFRPTRERRPEPDRFLDLKIALLLIGAVFGAVGMVRESRTLLAIAIAVVAAGFLLRFARRRPKVDE